MIVVEVSLWPGGDRSRAEDLGKAVIANESDLALLSSYSVRLLKGKRYSPRNAGSLWRQGHVKAFPRADERWGPWELLYLALEAALGSRLASLESYLGVKARTRSCTWTEDPDLPAWETSCDSAYFLADGTPSENRMKFCPFCGLKLEEVRRQEHEEHVSG